MTDFDLDRLGDLWRQRPTPEELESLRRAAEQGRRRARWAQAVDVGAAAVIAVVIVIMTLANPAADTMLFGSAAILILLASQIRHRKYRAIELRSLTGGTEEMLHQSIAQTQATLKRLRFQLLLIPAGLAAGLVLAHRAGGESGGQMFETVMASLRSGAPIVLIALASLIGLGFWWARALRNKNQELERLLALRTAYQRESSASDREGEFRNS